MTKNKTGVTLTLTTDKSEEMFYNSMCNGMHYMSEYGLVLDYDPIEYKKAKSTLAENKAVNGEICREDIWMQILRNGGKLTFVDEEGDDERHSITLKEVHERVQLADAQTILDMLNENDDAITADCILQTVFFKEIIFG
jgi:hypothetical protein